MAEVFDLVVIGGGPGGYVCAIRGAQNGLKTAIIEKYNTLGGTCLNVGCIPSKALLKSSEHFFASKHHMAEHGIEISGVKLDLKKMIERKDKVVSTNVSGVDFLMKKNKITRYLGHAKIISNTKVQFGNEVIEAKNIVIATGSKPAALPFAPFDKERIISSTEALKLKEVPKRLCVVGGGVIGLEMGSVWARLGSKVSVVEFGSTIIPNNDAQVQRILQKSLQDDLAMEFFLNHGVTSVQAGKKSIEVKAKNSEGKEISLEADYVLVAIGRKPYTESLGLEELGIEKDPRGFVKVNEHYQTKHANIYAIGDVIGGMMLAHKAEEEGLAVANLVAGKYGHVNYNAIPSVIYTYPEVASVGRTEEQLKAANIPFNTGKFNFAANGRAIASGETTGFVKVIAHKETDQILGVHMIGPHVSEMIAEMALAIEYYAASEDVGLTSHPHPTLSEAIKEAALAVTKQAIHGGS